MTRPPAPPVSERWVCLKCTGVHGAHFLTCPTLNCPPPVRGWDDEDVTR